MSLSTRDTFISSSQLNDNYHDAANSQDTATSMILFAFNTKSLNTAMISKPIRIQQSLHKCQSQLFKNDHTRISAIRNFQLLLSFCCIGTWGFLGLGLYITFHLCVYRRSVCHSLTAHHKLLPLLSENWTIKNDWVEWDGTKDQTPPFSNSPI